MTGAHSAGDRALRLSRRTAKDRLAVLDGWRAISIMSVLAGHLLPVNAVIPGGNDAAGATGMAIFFCLSGFLITRFLLDRPEWRPFLIRRALRILPLAWLAMALIYAMDWPAASPQQLAANLAFVANLPPSPLLPSGAHLWSLCVEMQFYLAIALLVALAGRRGLLALPLFALASTAARIVWGETISIVTWFRIDEILVGATLALVYSGEFGARARHLLDRVPLYAAAPAALILCYAIDTPLAYLRPYGVALMVGSTLAHAPPLARRLLESSVAAYIAAVSYALYVIHVPLTHTWLGSGDLAEKYLKRPLLIAVTFGLAHISTYRFENHFIDLGRRLTRRRPMQFQP